MPESKSVTYNPNSEQDARYIGRTAPYNRQPEEEGNYQIAQIGSFKIAFRTMPQDLKFLTTKQKQLGLPSLEKIKLESINIPEKTPSQETKIAPPTEIPFSIAQKNGEPAFAIDQELKGEANLKFEKTPQKLGAFAPEKSTPPKKTTTSSYKGAKLLYNRALYDDAIEKFIEVLDANPNHWRAKWYLNRAKKKIANIQKNILKSQQGESAEKKGLAEKLKQEQEKQKQIIAELETEAQAKKEAQAKAKIEAESRERVSKELELIEQEKTAAIAQAQQAQAGLKEIRQEAEEKVKQEFSQKLKTEEEQIRKEQEARHQLEAELVASEQEKKKMEEEIAQEREALLKSQQAITQQLAAMSQPETPASQYFPQDQLATAPLEPVYTPTIYAPAPLIPIPKTGEPKISIAARIAEFAESLFASKILASKTSKIIGAAIGLGAIAVGLIYFTGLYKIFSSGPQPAKPEIRQEEVLPTALLTINQTETIVLKAGQKKNLFQEINKIAGKSQPPGSFTRILVKFVNEDQQQKYASLTDLIDSLQIVFPSEVLSNMDGNYTLFLYTQKESFDSPFLASLGENKLGLVMTFREPSKVAGQFTNWQQAMATDLDALFLGKKISFGSDYQFQELSYSGILIHSLDLPNQYSSLNYAFITNKALIATSLESAQSLIDRLAPAK